MAAIVCCIDVTCGRTSDHWERSRLKCASATRLKGIGTGEDSHGGTFATPTGAEMLVYSESEYDLHKSSLTFGGSF